MQKIDGDFVFGEPKSRRSRRVVRLPAICIRALSVTAKSPQRGPTPASGTRFRINYQTSSSRPGLDDRSVRSIKQGLRTPPQASPGSARPGFTISGHTCASLLLLDGATDREIMGLLGHSSTNITMNIDESKRRLAARMDYLVGEN